MLHISDSVLFVSVTAKVCVITVDVKAFYIWMTSSSIKFLDNQPIYSETSFKLLCNVLSE